MTLIQARIILAVNESRNHSLYTDEILKETRIAASTFSAEQRTLVAFGLLEKRLIKISINDKLTRRMSYALTEKGRYVAAHLADISTVLNYDKMPLDFKSKS